MDIKAAGGVKLKICSTPIKTTMEIQTDRKENGSAKFPRWYVHSKWSLKYYISKKTL